MSPPRTLRIALVGRFDEVDVGLVLAWRVLERELAARLPGVRITSYAPSGDASPMPLDDGRPARPLAELAAAEAPDAVVVCDVMRAIARAGTSNCTLAAEFPGAIRVPEDIALGSLAPGLFEARLLDQRASYLRIVGALADGEIGVGCADEEPGLHRLSPETPLIDQVAAIKAAHAVVTDSAAVAEAAAAFGVRCRARVELVPRKQPGAALDAICAELAAHLPPAPEWESDLAAALARAEHDRDRMRALYDGALARAGTAGIGRAPASGGLEDAAVLQAELQRVYASRSWRWLAPLRALNARRHRRRAR